MSEGIRAAQRILDLTVEKNGAWFKRTDVTVESEGGMPAVVARAELGSELAVAPAAWEPTPSVDFPGALARFDLSSAAMRSVPVPGDPPDGSVVNSDFFRYGWPGG